MASDGLGDHEQPDCRHHKPGDNEPALLQIGRPLGGAEDVGDGTDVSLDDRRQVRDHAGDVVAVAQVQEQDRAGAGQFRPAPVEESRSGDYEKLRRRVVDEVERGADDADDCRLAELTSLPRVERDESRQRRPHAHLEPVGVSRPLVDDDLGDGICARVAPRQQHRRGESPGGVVRRADQRERRLSGLDRLGDDHDGVRAVDPGDAGVGCETIEGGRIWFTIDEGDDIGERR